ncbi:MAG: phosphate acyltransferase PlsX [Coriobacteriia bacterium]|nr:phosphate acyltransferase PlsX [Coriobacteriia bacterium]
MRVVLDVEGGDHAPGPCLEGAELALAQDPGLELVLVGLPEHVQGLGAGLAERYPGRAIGHAATQVIGMDEHPAEAVRNKPDSSLVVSAKLVKEGEAEGFFSAGSSGACMAAATLYTGRIKGVSRPAIAAILPGRKGPVVLADVGANADVNPEYLLQFAYMTKAYAEAVLGITEPRVGLVNIGAEDTKGSQLAKEAYACLKQGFAGFAGNAEGHDILSGAFDCVVTDGFTGNVILKTIEGVSTLFFSELKEMLGANLRSKLAAALAMPGLRGIKERFSAEAVGGAPLLGVQGSCLVGHGSSSAQAIANGIAATAKAARAGLPALIAQAIEP